MRELSLLIREQKRSRCRNGRGSRLECGAGYGGATSADNVSPGERDDVAISLRQPRGLDDDTVACRVHKSSAGAKRDSGLITRSELAPPNSGNHLQIIAP